MSQLFSLASTYELLCNIWPRFPYYIPGTQRLFKPFRYLFNITNKCNLACVYCCQKTSMSQNRPELSCNEILGIVKKLPRYGVIALCGGEPLCREDFLEIVKGIHQLKKKTTLLTNGLLLNDAVICGIIQNKLLNIGIAVDGDQPYYEKIKGKGNYPLLMDKLDRLTFYKKKLRTSLPAVDWKVTVFPENVRQLPLLYKQAIQCCADTFTVSLPKKNDFQFSDCLHGLEVLDCPPEPEDNFQFPDDTRMIYEELLLMGKHAKTKIRVYPRLKHADDLINYFNQFEIQQRYARCREPWCGLVISVIGEVYPCLSVKIGDIRKQSLSRILCSPENTQFRKRLKKQGIFPLCDGCCYAKLKPVNKKGGSACA
ncbi:MAG TPA: radical SAM protein [Smithella sp.]|nr:radical SAM protein [Smithella sp.]